MIGSKLFFNGGIGDFLALEPYFSDLERRKVTDVYMVTRKAASLSTVATLAFPNPVETWSIRVPQNRWDYTTLQEWINDPSRGCEIVSGLKDWTIRLRFREIVRGARPYRESLLMNRLLQTRRDRPAFAVICPYSSDKRQSGRDFSPRDWELTIAWLAKHNLKGYVFNDIEEPVPDHPLLVDFSMAHTLLGSMSLAMDAVAYIGIDSCFSVLLAKRLPETALAVRSVNAHLYSWKEVYYAPHTTFGFLGRELEPLLARTAPHGSRDC